MNELHNIFTIFVNGGILLACGLMLLFAAIPDNPRLANYRLARRVMACAYLVIVVAGVVRYIFQPTLPDIPFVALMQVFTIIIAILQSFLFTFAILSVLKIQFPGWRFMSREIAYVVIFIAIFILTYNNCTAETFRFAFYGLAFIYVILLIHYTFLFVTRYRQFRLQMDNYFSDEEAGRLRWVAFSFFSALAIGIMALLSAIFMSELILSLFVVIYDVFYIFFAIRFINYAHQFQSIENAMDKPEQEHPGEIQQEEILMDGMEVELHDHDTFKILEKRIEEWMANEGFTEPGITIETLSSLLYTNSKYLSVYINTHKQQTFREWINELRIDKAKLLLLQYPQMTINEVALKIGFSDKSHFLRQFKKQTNISTSEWKKIAKTQDFPICTPKQS